MYVTAGPNKVVTAGTSAVDLLPEGQDRRKLIIQNQGSSNVWVAFGEDATTSNGILLKPGLALVYEHPNVPDDRISAISDQAGQSVVVQVF